EAQTISITDTTPAAVVAAINAAGKGLSAQLINTGEASTPYKIMVTGDTGLAKAFTLSSPTADLDWSGSALQAASNATLNVDGVDITSASNSVSDAIAGATLNLLAPTTSSGSGNATSYSAASLSFNLDPSGVKTKLQALVSAYNDASQLLTEVSDPKSTLATYGATLVGNSVVSTLRNQMRELVTTDSSTKSGSISALRDLGVSIDAKGKLAINSVTMDLALQFHYSDAVTMLSGNQQDQSEFDTSAAGVAGDAFKKLTTALASTGTITTESNNATQRITKYQDDLTKLEDRMTILLASYTKQFSIMDSLVGQTNTLRTSLTSSFAGMMAMYTNKG
ncbi:MAG: flagellar filament capping protein FliD, partial [Rhodoferax sp.]